MLGRNRNAFTLIELLVVIAVIAVLMAILMPALQRTKEAAKTIKCQANLRNLTTAWYTYATDNDDKLCGSWNYNGSNWGQSSDWAPWEVNGNTAVSDYLNATIQERYEGIMKGVLYPYTKNVASYHCPSDDSAGDNFRSYSMPDSLNGWWSKDIPSSTTKANWNNLTRLSQVGSPSEAYVLLEENDPRGYNINSWAIDPAGPGVADNWSDPMVVWHGSRSSFGFADGHAETWKWSIETMKFFRDFRTFLQPVPNTPEGIDDLRRVHHGWPKLKRAAGSR